MSSYVSSTYIIERSRRMGIVAQCQRELQQATQEAQANREAWLAMLDRRNRTQSELNNKERLEKSEAQLQYVQLQEQRKRRAVQLKQMLQRAEQSVKQLEALGADGTMRERLHTMKQGLSMFGASEELLAQVKHFNLEELPRRKEQMMQQRQASQEQQLQRAKRQMSVQVKDGSTNFVSMQTEPEQQKPQHKVPWDLFIQRLKILCEKEEKLGESQAHQMLEEARQTAPARRNLFLLQKQDQMEQLEQQLAALEDVRQIGDAHRQQLQDQYLALCMLCGEQTVLTSSADTTELELENARLFHQYRQEKERQYVTNALSRVLEQFGIEFEEMQTTANGHLHLKYQVSQQAQLHITRSDTGAFEMQFAGTIEGETASMDEKRQILEQAHSFCSHLPKIAAALQQYGIQFDQTAMQEPNEETVAIHSIGQNRSLQQSKKQMKMPQ